MSPSWLVSVLVGYVAGVVLAALVLPDGVGRLWWRALLVAGGLLALGLAAMLWHRARPAPSPQGHRRRLWDGWDALVALIDRGLDRLLPPSPPPREAGAANAAATSAGLRRQPAKVRPAGPGAGLWPIVRLPQRVACMAWLPAGEERSTGRELGRLARAIGLARDLGFANRATALLVELDPLVLATAGARSRIAAFVEDRTPSGCTLVPVFRLEGERVPEDLPLDLVMDLAAPERLEFGLLLEEFGTFEAERLRRLGFGWLMVPRGPFLAAGPDDGLDPALMARLERLRQAEIRVIVRDLASERELLEVLDYPVDFATGPLFRPAVEEVAEPAPRRRVA